MSPEETAAHEYCKQYKKNKLQEHKIAHASERPCRGLTSKQWILESVRQKSTFKKSKRFSCNKLWNHLSVPTDQGFLSLTIKII